MADFHDRRQRAGSGRFITRDQIEKEDPLRLTDLFRSVPGVRIVPSLMGGSRVRLRSSTARDCVPFVWVDGVPMGAGEFDLDVLTPETVEGVEIYSGVSGVPQRFMGTRGEGSCGAIVVWTGFAERRAQREEALRAAGAGMGVRVNLETLRAELEAYEADDVDEPARLEAEPPPTLAYPDSLLRARVAGAVLVAFVVDTSGTVDMETVDVLAATHPLFATAVRDMLATARYAPARREGRAVPQVVQQPVRFSPANDR